MKIFKPIALSFIVLMFSYSCKKGEAKQKEFNNEIITDSTATMKNNLPYTSDNVKQYYKIDSDSISYVVNSLHKGLVSASFDEKNKTIPIKENDFEIQPDSKYKYYVLETFKFSYTNTAKLIIYNIFGENDSKILNIQLNSYINNTLVDQLLLDCRFTFETEYYRTFTIGTEKNIEIIKHSVDNLEYNEEGDIVGEKKHADSAKVKVDYTIDKNGKFVKK
ncbi:hypothetical protein [Chryseobacterium scophthalmum]|uniref:Lipoprotein n=1 Tax=Chryseobacterium scophthalmum TaxID=59733 RepID=A0A1N6I1T2_9FLAO|nr:hypothetical protein [Chryseobacterium scophthalmum]SIO25909.1 hypothetical protein SAMN05421769_3096 [Chryseobacterium scophthalmum]